MTPRHCQHCGQRKASQWRGSSRHVVASAKHRSGEARQGMACSCDRASRHAVWPLRLASPVTTDLTPSSSPSPARATPSAQAFKAERGIVDDGPARAVAPTQPSEAEVMAIYEQRYQVSESTTLAHRLAHYGSPTTRPPPYSACETRSNRLQQ
jgi:hypothetical protein